MSHMPTTPGKCLACQVDELREQLAAKGVLHTTRSGRAGEWGAISPSTHFVQGLWIRRPINSEDPDSLKGWHRVAWWTGDAADQCVCPAPGSAMNEPVLDQCGSTSGLG